MIKNVNFKKRRVGLREVFAESGEKSGVEGGAEQYDREANTLAMNHPNGQLQAN